MTKRELDKSKIFEPLYQITTAKELLLFTIRIRDLFKKGEIEESKFSQTIVFDGLRIQGAWKSNDVNDLSHNLLLCALGSCFVVIDEALNGIFGDKPNEYSDSDIDALRAIIYMFRCAISHGPTAPRWKAEGKYRRNFEIREIDYQLNIGELNGKYFKHVQYGGLPGVGSLINYSLEIAKRHSVKDKEDDDHVQ